VVLDRPLLRTGSSWETRVVEFPETGIRSAAQVRYTHLRSPTALHPSATNGFRVANNGIVVERFSYLLRAGWW
jgi:hypothetical protein